MYRLKSRKEREQNVRNTFKIEKDYSHKNILIVDDIVTTGSTLKELERELLENQGVKNVVFFTVAVVREYFK